MTCRKAYELDLAAFLADPTGGTWTEFRDHYPRCAACSAEVRTWTELHLALGSASHPDPEEIVRFVDGSAALPPTRRHAIADHLAVCPACRDEAHTLRTFDPLTAPTADGVRPRRRRFTLPSLGHVLWHPAFAYAVALLAVLYPMVSGRMMAPTGMPIRDERVARREPSLDEREEGAQKYAADEPRAKTPAATPAGNRARADEERDVPDAVPGAPGYVGGGRVAGEATASLADRKQRTPMTAPVEILLGDGESTIVIPPGVRDVVLRVTDAPGTVTGFTIATTGPTRRRTVRTGETERGGAAGGAAIRVSAGLLAPGTYAVTLLAGERAVGERHFRVVAP